MAFLIYCSSLILVLFSYFPAKCIALESDFLTFDLGALAPASSSDCSRPLRLDSAATGSNTRALELFHRAGPCSPEKRTTQNKLEADIVSNDQYRLNFIRARSKYGFMLQNQYNVDENNKSTPVQSFHPIKELNYAVTVGLGTPPQNVTLVLDTGSSVTWTQCQPCAGNCFHQLDPLYDPRSSKTYSDVPCNSPQCSNLGYNLSCYTGPCVYHMLYGDGSFSVGTVSKDTLTVTPTTDDDVFRDFVFGCGQKNEGSFATDMDGLLGLGPDPFNGSFLYQTTSKYGQQFSYCLPSTPSSTGHLTFGRNEEESPENVTFTPLSPDPYFYRIDIVAISVGGTRLPINQSVFTSMKTVIDSGTGISRLPMDVYATMRDAFKKKTGYKFVAPMDGDIFDTCFDFGSGRHAEIRIPKISFMFKGGAEVELDSSGIINMDNETVGCLAFAGNSDPDDVTIFGNIQQKTFEVVYDIAGGKIGFVPNGCK